jgi:hypothetical protein
MSRVIVIEFVSLDGVMHDPDGSEGSRQGGWAFRYGPEAAGCRLPGRYDEGRRMAVMAMNELLARLWRLGKPRRRRDPGALARAAVRGEPRQFITLMRRVATDD